MPDSRILKIEKLLAIAHKCLWAAAAESESMRDTGLTDDLYGLCGEVGRVNVDLLQGTARRRPVAR